MFKSYIKIEGKGTTEQIINSLKEIVSNLEMLPPSIGIQAPIEMEDDVLKCYYKELTNE